MPLSHEIAAALLNEFRETPESRCCLRRAVCVDVAKGSTYKEAAKKWEVSVSSAKRWFRAYKNHEAAGLEEKVAGAPARLTQEHIEAIQAVLGKRPRQVGLQGEEWTGRKLVEWLQRQHSITVSDRHARRLLVLLRPRK